MSGELPWYGSTTIRTVSGLEIDMLDPKPEQIRLTDIARALAMSCRFGGHVRRFYSVAEHSVVVANLLGERGFSVETRRIGLLHDAAEAYIGDLISPMKRALLALGGREGIDELELRWCRAIGTRFDVVLHALPQEVIAADQDAFVLEREALAELGQPETPWYEAEAIFGVAASLLRIR